MATFAESQAAAVAMVRGATSDPPADLREERAHASFAPSDLADYLYGKETAARRRYLETLVSRYSQTYSKRKQREQEKAGWKKKGR